MRAPYFLICRLCPGWFAVAGRGGSLRRGRISLVMVCYAGVVSLASSLFASFPPSLLVGISSLLLLVLLSPSSSPSLPLLSPWSIPPPSSSLSLCSSSLSIPVVSSHRHQVLSLSLGVQDRGEAGVCVSGGSPLTALGVGLGIWRGENRRDENEPQ